MMKPQVLRGNCGLCRSGLHETPISAISFFDVDLKESIAAGIGGGQAGRLHWLIRGAYFDSFVFKMNG